jgi:hypothetical protein
MIDILALLTGFILISQTMIILVYMCIRKRINNLFYKKWINERNDFNLNLKYNKEEEEDGFYV